MTTKKWLPVEKSSCEEWRLHTLNGVMGSVWKGAEDKLWRYGVSKNTAIIKELGNSKTREEAMRMVEVEVGQ